jgi:pyruvate dehydrogenase complex dehydrogenase (E1) component
MSNIANYHVRLTRFLEISPMATAVSESRQELVSKLEALDTRLRWLSSWTVHNANHIREKRDSMKVGGHQASCASMTAIMATLYFNALRPQDKVAVKPHAGPVLHAIHYLLGNDFAGLVARKVTPRGPRTRSRSISRPVRSASASPSLPLPVWFRTI